LGLGGRSVLGSTLDNAIPHLKGDGGCQMGEGRASAGGLGHGAALPRWQTAVGGDAPIQKPLNSPSCVGANGYYTALWLR
jgi:hypothetical protein